MNWSIRFQLLLPLLILLLGALLMTVSAGISSANQATNEIESELQQVIETVQQATFPLTPKVLQLLKGFSGADYLLIKDGKSPITTLPLPSMPEHVQAEKEEAGMEVRLQRQVVIDETEYLYARVRLHRGPDTGSILYIYYPEYRYRDALLRAVRPSLLFGVVGGLVAFFIALWFAERITRRIRQFQKQTLRIAEGDFTSMPATSGSDELNALGKSISDMAEQLSAYRDKIEKGERLRLLGQVSGGLAHQMRNAVTGARLAVQVHARGCPESSDRESLEVALRQLALMESHLKRFFALGQTELRKQDSCNVANILQETISLLVPQAKHAGIEIQWNPPHEIGELVVIGDHSQLSHLFLNIINNALEAAGPGGWVNVEIKPMDRKIIIQVRDSGTGPPEEIRNNLFEPFVTRKKDGIGLGLAVARQIAEEHGGHLTWHRELTCTCFEIVLARA